MTTLLIILTSFSIAALWFISGFLVGRAVREIQDQVLALRKQRQAPAPPPERPSASIVDPDDPVQVAKWRADEMRKRLNADE